MKFKNKIIKNCHNTLEVLLNFIDNIYETSDACVLYFPIFFSNTQIPVLPRIPCAPSFSSTTFPLQIMAASAEPMYRLPPYYSNSGLVDLPTCMYSLSNYHDSDSSSKVSKCFEVVGTDGDRFARTCAVVAVFLFCMDQTKNIFCCHRF